MILALLGALALAFVGFTLGSYLGRYTFMDLMPERVASMFSLSLAYVVFTGVAHSVFMHFTMRRLPDMGHIAFVLALVTCSVLVWFAAFFWPAIRKLMV